jgi:hypothetical protein
MSRILFRIAIYVLLGMVVSTGLVACSGGTAPAAPAAEEDTERVETQAAEPQENQVTQAPGDAEEPEASTLPAATAESMPTPPAAPVETEPEQASPAPVREGLAATDPGTVQLASGEVQLVEFFAFW